MAKKNVLITATGTITANNVINVLKPKYRIIGTDTNWKGFCVGGYTCDGFYRVHPATDGRFLNDLLEICRVEKVDILIPIMDSELIPIQKQKHEFEALGVKMLLPSINTLNICNDKWETYNFFRGQFFFTPETKIVKPREGVGSRGIEIIQEYIKGEEVTVDAFVDDKKVYTCPRKRLEVKAGVSYKGVTFRDDELESLVEDMLLEIDMVGACNVQAIKRDNSYFFIEINPRFSGGLALSIKAGFNSPQMLIDKLMGKQIVPPKIKEKVYMVRGVKEYFCEG
jgi:carbamoyl-phosphate synthase large subunit